MRRPSIATLVSVTALIGATFAAMQWLGWPPYAAKAAVDELSVQVQANSVTTLYIQLENAIKSGDVNQILRLCWAIQDATGQKPAGCP